jgi:cytoskeletal protein CcmA (bactofilin family)
MATPFFGKRETETPQPSNPLNTSRPAAPGLSPGYGSTGAQSTSSGATSSASAASKPFGSPPAAVAVGSQAVEGGSKLTVGPNIKLKGVEITDCDTLVVEGMVEATMDSRVIQIAEQGAFKGSAEIDVAEIRGEFHGNLTVRQKLVIYSTGKVTGTIRYGKLVIEEGGQLSGEIQFGFDTVPSAKPAAVPTRPELQAA